MRREHGAGKDKHVGVLALFFQNVGKVRETRFEAHHMPLTQAVDGRICHLAEILTEELADQAGLIADDGQRRVIAHRSNGFLAIFDHRREDHFNIFKRHAGGDLTLGQFRARPRRGIILPYVGQVGDRPETTHECAIILLRRDAVFQLAIAVQFAFVEVDRNHLAGAKAALFQYCRFGKNDHAGFGTDDEQIVRRAAVAQRAKGVAVNACNRPMAVGHGKCCWAIPWFHDARHIFIHRAV